MMMMMLSTDAGGGGVSRMVLLILVLVSSVPGTVLSQEDDVDYVDECPVLNGFFADAVQCDRYYECKNGEVRADRHVKADMETNAWRGGD